MGGHRSPSGSTPTSKNYSSSQLRLKENIRSQRPPHPLHRVPLLIRHRKKTEPLFLHLSEYLYNAMPRIQGDHLETNHPDNNYNPLGMPKKSSLFTSTNVEPGDQLNTQFEIWYGIRCNGYHCFLRREEWSRWRSVAVHLFHWLKTIVQCGSFLVIFRQFFGS